MTSKLISLPTEAENKKLEDLFLAVFFNDMNKVIDFKSHYPEIYEKKDRFLIDGSLNFDLTNLTFFNQTIWNDVNWREQILPLVKRNRQRTEQMLNFWWAEFDQQQINREIEYNHYFEYFYCDDPNDFEEIILDPISKYLDRGFRERDLKLYNRAQCFDFSEAKKLLEQGAKSNIHFDRDGDSSTISRILNERSYLASCKVIPEFKAIEEKGYNQDFNISRMFGDLLGLAAHEEMYKLLRQYGDEE